MTAFFDTNVLLYAQQSGPKGDTARSLLARGGIISVQVLNEFAAVATRKFNRDWHEVASAIDDILAMVEPPVPLTVALHHAARALAASDRVGFCDALIVCAARQAGCDHLYSEDLQSGRRFGPLRIVNPFAA